MVYSGTIVTEAEMTFMAGEGVDATGSIEANHQFLANYAEAYLSSIAKYDIVTNWASIDALYKAIFTEWAARYGGMQLVLFNTAGYTDRTEAEDIVNVHIWRMEKIEKRIETSDIKDFIGT